MKIKKREPPEQVRKRRKRWYSKKVTDEPSYNYKNSLRKYYNLSYEDYIELVNKQLGVCWICRQPETARTRKTDKNPKRLAVDHNHLTGRVRGLLCSRCNHGIGNFKESPELLQRAIEYLKNNN